MLDILKEPDDIKIICQDDNIDAVIRTELKDRKLKVFLKANESFPKYVLFRWKHKVDRPIKIMGDKWERAYGDMEWLSLNGENFMPWYFLANSGNETVGCGVMVQPNSFVCFQCDASGVSAWFDVRCGTKGVKLNGRELHIGTIVCEHYYDMSAFGAGKLFCKVMSPNPILPKEPIYGSNNWYYAYGDTSFEKIMVDAELISELSGDNENRPYMVIDNGWGINLCDGPWVPNEKFGDMKKVAEGFIERGVKPGIWFRPLHDSQAEMEHPEWRLRKYDYHELYPSWTKVGEKEYLGFLDPSHPGVKEYLRSTIRRFKEWGYQLIKHDFSTHDIFDFCGCELNGEITITNNWTFYDGTKTSAEIVLDFYRLLREEAGDMAIIGCCTISHLCAGLVEVNRIGDDTSGKLWNRTRIFGVNTLAFRLCQNNSFYKVDADCVGILGNNIDWKLNKQWLDLLAKSGSPLFVSAQPEALTDEMKGNLKAALKINSIQADEAEPLDWMYNNTPQKWLINGEEVEYDFVMESYPTLMKRRKFTDLI